MKTCLKGCNRESGVKGIRRGDNQRVEADRKQSFKIGVELLHTVAFADACANLSGCIG
jgi:hypothetical protein